MMSDDKAFQKGERVKLVLDKEVSPDNQWHGKEGEIVDIMFDDAGSATDDPEDNFMYEVELVDDDASIPKGVHFRRHDLRKVEE